MDEIVFEEYGQVSAPVDEGDLTGFFEDRASRPSASVLLSVLAGSYCSFIARTHDGRVVGIATAISDGVLSAYITLLEVLPEFRRQGIGSRLMQLVLTRVEGLSMVDLTCDEDLVSFYLRFGINPSQAMSLRRPHGIPST